MLGDKVPVGRNELADMPPPQPAFARMCAAVRGPSRDDGRGGCERGARGGHAFQYSVARGCVLQRNRDNGTLFSHKAPRRMARMRFPNGQQ